jgi:ABC-type sugar transport system substrate-binding protein
MEEYLKMMAKVSGDLWKVFKTYCLSMNPKSDDWWQNLSDDMDAAAKKYYGTEYEKYAREYAVDLVYEIERRAKKNDG